MTSIEMVRPRGQGRGATSATTEDVETLLPASEPPAGARTANAAPVAVARGNGVGLFERLGDVADAMLPPPPPPRDPADRRRVWTWATVSFLLMCVMWSSVAGGPGAGGSRTREMALDGPPSIENQQRDRASAVERSFARGSGLARDDTKETDRSDGASYTDVAEASDGSSSADAGSDAEVEEEATATKEIPIPRTKGTCVTRSLRAPRLERSPSPEPETGGGGASGSAPWLELAGALAAEAGNSTSDLILVGDSITEAWRGTSFGAPRAEYASAPEILNRRLGEYSPLPLAIAGDTTSNVLWRLRNGGFPDKTIRSGSRTVTSPPFVVLLIGTNDLSVSVRDVENGGVETGCASDADVAALFKSGVPSASAGIIACVEELVKRAPDSRIVVLGITPRGERVYNRVSYLQPSVWSAAIDATNANVERALENGKRGVSSSFGGSRRYRNVVFQPCSEPFLVRDAAGGGKRVDERLMRDGLHPNGAGGFDALAECVADGVEKAKRIP